MPQKNSTLIKQKVAHARAALNQAEQALVKARQVVDTIEQLAIDIAGNDERLDPTIRKQKRAVARRKER